MNPEVEDMTDREILVEIVTTLREARAVIEGMQVSPMMGVMAGLLGKRTP